MQAQLVHINPRMEFLVPLALRSKIIEGGGVEKIFPVPNTHKIRLLLKLYPSIHHTKTNFRQRPFVGKVGF